MSRIELLEANLVLFGLLAWFEFLGLSVAYLGWIMYAFAVIPCVAVAKIDSPWLGYPLLAAHLVGFPVLKRRAMIKDPNRSFSTEVKNFFWGLLTGSYGSLGWMIGKEIESRRAGDDGKRPQDRG